MQKSISYQGTKALRRSCRKVLEAEEHQGPGDLARVHRRTWGQRNTKAQESCKDLEAKEYPGHGELAGPGSREVSGRSSKANMLGNEMLAEMAIVR